MPWTQAGWRRFLPQPTLQARPRIGRFVRELPSSSRWIDLGAGGRQLRSDVLRVDADLGYPVEVVGDAHCLPFERGTLHAVVTTGTLEHVRLPAVVLREIHRVLEPGGLLYVEVPFLQGYHADPDDYWRFTESGLRLILSQNDFEVLESGMHMGPFSAICWILAELIATLFGQGVLRKVGLLLGRLLVWPLKFLDYLVMRLPGSARVASGVWAIGRPSSTGRNGAIEAGRILP